MIIINSACNSNVIFWLHFILHIHVAREEERGDQICVLYMYEGKSGVKQTLVV